jgi:integral membrane sensor domain MASE1
LKYKLPLEYNIDVRIILVAILYYLSARLGYFLAFEDTTALPAWPPSGIAFALIILLGRTAWPGITIGAMVANLMAYWNNQDVPQHTLIAISSIIALGETLEILAGNYLVSVWIKDSYPFKSAKDTFRFLFVTLCMSGIGASIGTFALYFNGVILWVDTMKNGFTWWVGNVVGILLFTPFILAVAQKRKFEFKPNQLIEVGLFLITISGFYFLIRFGYSMLPSSNHYLIC